MEWFSKAKDKFRETTDGVESKRERLKIVGKLIGDTISNGATAAHDNLVLRKHEASRAPAPCEGRFGTAKIRVEAIAAADLRKPFVGELDPYCMIAVGQAGTPWAAKARSGAVLKTPVMLRQRHPRWLEPHDLPLPLEACGAGGSDMELTVRVMDAHATRADTCLGEARLSLKDGAESCAVSVRLLGGGFASCSLRWTVVRLDGAAGEALLRERHPSVDEWCAEALEGGRPARPRTLTDYPEPSASGLNADAALEDFCDLGDQEQAERTGHDDGRAPLLSAVDFCDDAADEGRQASEGAVEVLNPSSLGLRSRLREDPFAAAFQFWMAAVADDGGDAAGDGAAGPSARAVRQLTAALAPGSAAFSAVKEATDSEADVAGVNELVLQAPLAWVLEGCESEAIVEAFSRSMYLLGPLARSRVAGVLVEQLQQLGLPADGVERTVGAKKKERLLHDLLQTSIGDDLMELKRLIDTAGTGHNLLSACATIPPELHTSLMDHFTVQGSKVLKKPVHILSDIDMTVWVGAFGAGGPKFPQGPIPGALSLFRALGGRITFLSARPPVWESRTRGALLDDIGIAEATVLQGTLENVVRCLFQPEEARKGMGQQKEKSFNEFVDLYPEARFVFFGDSGEGDVDFAVAFMKDTTGAAAVSVNRVALIHDVVGTDGVQPKTSPEQREALGRKGVHVFDTYVGAAVRLYRLGILDEWDLRHAAQSCADELHERAPGEFRSLDVVKARQDELRRDMDAMSAAISGKQPEAATGGSVDPFFVSPYAAKEHEQLEAALGLAAPAASASAEVSSGDAAAASAPAGERGAALRKPALRRDSGESQASDLAWE